MHHVPTEDLVRMARIEYIQKRPSIFLMEDSITRIHAVGDVEQPACNAEWLIAYRTSRRSSDAPPLEVFLTLPNGYSAQRA